MRTPFTSSRIIRPLLLGTPIAVVLAFVIFASSSPFYFEVTIQSSLSSTAQVYYDIGFGIRDADSVRRPIRDGNAALRYRFPLPNGTYRGLRFDPSDLGGASITIRNALIVDRGGHVLRKFRPVQFRPAQQISRFDVQKDVLLVATASGGTDPILSIDVNDRFTLKESPINAVAHAARLFLVCLLTVTGVGLLASTVAIQLRPLVTGWSLAAANWTRRSPRKALLVIAVTSVVISCYPVVFFGKSFLSPNNHSGTFLLYGRMPTVPGYRDATTDDEKGSDLGAAIWYSWPVSIVESRALFRNFELPLWNRYNSTGLPLLGQGQSTFGDPLHLLVLLGGSSSGWWDLKYILAKLLFAICLGLCVLQATKHLPAALIISASVPFIGFFFWRYNHPAFFSFCYAPWILFCYFKLIDAPAGRRTVVWFTALILADWMVATSGTVKEAYVLLLAMNSCGLLITLLYGPPNRAKVAKLIGVVFASFLFVLLATPVWLTFLDSLKVSRTAYDAAGAYQIQPSLFIGLFDDIFYRQFNANETNLDPSANFLILLAVLWFLVSSRKDGQIAFSRGLSIGCLVALAFVFGIVPSSWIDYLS